MRSRDEGGLVPPERTRNKLALTYSKQRAQVYKSVRIMYATKGGTLYYMNLRVLVIEFSRRPNFVLYMLYTWLCSTSYDKQNVFLTPVSI